MSTRTRQGRRMSLQGLARLLRKNRGSLSAWIAAGCPAQPSPGGAGVEWSLDPAEVVAWLVAREGRRVRASLEAKHGQVVARLEAALRKADEGAPISLEEGRRREQAAKAVLAEIAVEERQGILIDRHERDEADVALFSAIRQHLLGVPVKAAPEAHGAPTVSACASAIRQEIEAALSELADAEVSLVARAGDGRS